MGAMKVSLKSQIFVLASFLAGVAAVSAEPAAPPPEEYGFKGVKRIELVFQNGAVNQKAAAPSPLPADDLLNRNLAEHRECKAIGVTLGNAGLQVVAQCKPDDPTCAKLYLTVENHSGGAADRVYLVGVELSQQVKLVRDEKVQLTMPTTWTMHTVAVVASDTSGTEAACIGLRSLGSYFGTSWRVANK